MPDPSDYDFPGYGPDSRAGRGGVPVLVRPDGALLPGVDDEAAWPAGGGDELSWSFRCDLAGALAGLDPSLTGGDQEQLLADLEVVERSASDAEASSANDGDSAAACDSASAMLGLVADALPTGPGLAAWVAQYPPAQLPDVDLPAVAAALRRVTSWAQAAELAVVAQIAARSAARDPHAGLGDDGRPAAVTRDAAAQAGLALTLSPGAASWWTDLAVTLGWRLPATAAALSAGQIDLARARIIAEATAVLSDDTARAAEAQVLPAAGSQTYGQLRAAVARSVILADPQGAEERRQATERRARVGLYPGDHHTATLTGMNLPAVHAAAAMARLTALARAMQAASAGGGIDLLRSHAYLGLLLNTLPLIPPRPDAPPDTPPEGPDDPGPGGPGPGGPWPGDPGPGGSDDSGPGDGQLDDDGTADPDSTGRPETTPRGRTRRRGSGDPGTPPRPGTTRTGRRHSPNGQPAPDHSTPDDTPPDDSASQDQPPPGGPGGPDPGPDRPRPRAPDRPDSAGRHPGGPHPGPPGDPPDRPDPPAPPPPGSASAAGPPPGPGQAGLRRAPRRAVTGCRPKAGPPTPTRPPTTGSASRPRRSPTGTPTTAATRTTTCTTSPPTPAPSPPGRTSPLPPQPPALHPRPRPASPPPHSDIHPAWPPRPTRMPRAPRPDCSS